MASTTRTDTAIDTRSGLILDFASPDPSQISIEDIAAGLSMVCRFGGQALAFYSVAQHALLVKELVERGGRPELALPALHHDSHEAYACDIPKPLKRLIEKPYAAVTNPLDRAIEQALDIPPLTDADTDTIKRADDDAFDIEADQLLNRDAWHPSTADPPTTIVIDGEERPLLNSTEAQTAFLEAHWTSMRR